MIEVRCCCQPRKLLGYLDIPTPRAGHIVFPLPGERGFDSLSLPVATFQDENGNRYKAIKSEETPIETLRRLPCFIEVAP
jgi:hypothetical protein